MKQATEPGFYWDPDGNREVEIRAGLVRPDGHPDVLRCPTIFTDVNVEDPAPPAPPPPPPPRPAKAAKADQGAPAAPGT
jgi:hypothetical protein